MSKTVKIVLGAVFVLMIAYLLYVRFQLIFSYSTDIAGAEFGIINYVQVLQLDQPLYQDPDAFPFLSVLITPLYPYLLYGVSEIFGYDAIQGIHELLVTARVISLLCMFINLGFIYLIFRQLKLPAFYFLSSVAIYLFLISGHFYSTRPDAVKTTLFTIFLYTSLRYLFFEGGVRYLIFSMIAGLLAISFKQDAIINLYVYAGMLWLILMNQKTRMLIFTLTFSLIVLLGIYHFIFGEYFFANTVALNLQGNASSLTSYNIVIVAISVIRNIPFLILVSWGIIKTTKQDRSSIYFLLGITGILSFIIAHVFMFRPGSFLNYSHEAILLLLISSALMLHQYRNVFLQQQTKFSVLLILYIAVLFVTNKNLNTHQFSAVKETTHRQDYISSLQDRDAVIAFTGEDTLFFPNPKDAMFYADRKILYGYELHFDRYYLNIYLRLDSLFNTAAKQYGLSTANYDRCFTAGTVNYIIIDKDPVYTKYMQEYFPCYAPVHGFSRMAIYKYNGALNKTCL